MLEMMITLFCVILTAGGGGGGGTPLFGHYGNAPLNKVQGLES